MVQVQRFGGIGIGDFGVVFRSDRNGVLHVVGLIRWRGFEAGDWSSSDGGQQGWRWSYHWRLRWGLGTVVGFDRGLLVRVLVSSSRREAKSSGQMGGWWRWNVVRMDNGTDWKNANWVESEWSGDGSSALVLSSGWNQVDSGESTRRRPGPSRVGTGTSKGLFRNKIRYICIIYYVQLLNTSWLNCLRRWMGFF